MNLGVERKEKTEAMTTSNKININLHHLVTYRMARPQGGIRVHKAVRPVVFAVDGQQAYKPRPPSIRRRVPQANVILRNKCMRTEQGDKWRGKDEKESLSLKMWCSSLILPE